MIYCSLPMKHKLFKMEYLVSCVAFALLFLAHIIPSEASDTGSSEIDANWMSSSTTEADDTSETSTLEAICSGGACRTDSGNTVKGIYNNGTYVFYDVRGPLVLTCNVSLQDASKAYELKWLKNDNPLAEDAHAKDRFRILSSENKLVFDRTTENDAGKYTCFIDIDVNKKADIEVVGKPTTRMPENVNVVEGEKLRLVCAVVGKPSPSVEWFYGSENTPLNESSGRYILSDENDVKNAVMLVNEASLDDRGNYYCTAKNIANDYIKAPTAGTFVRVKDKLAALWPFLGICAEVFVLCAIILVYEKRRNKPDMEESDTDQSPDQKQDHGKDRDVRQRK